MVEAPRDLQNKLTLGEINALPPEERSRYYERYLFGLIKANDRGVGLTQTEIENMTGLSSNTLSKYLEMLFSKRKVYRIKRGRTLTYFPNGKVLHPIVQRDIIAFDDKNLEHRYKAYVVDNFDGKFLYLQEKEITEDGFEDVIGGVMIPRSGVEQLSKVLLEADEFLSDKTLEIEE